MKILLQFPEGLKKIALEHTERYRKEGHEVFLSASACYGACDLALDEARAVKADKIIHFGHAPFLKTSPIPVEYVEYHEDADLEKIKSAVKKIPEKKIALATTVQHIHQLKNFRNIFMEAGKDVFVGKGELAHHEGQILGCDFKALKNEQAEAAVIIAGGLFHGAGIFIDKPVYVIHPKTGEVRNISSEIEKARKRRKGAVLKAVEAKSFGVMLSTKPGQFKPGLAEDLAEKIRDAGAKAEVVVANNLDPNSLNNFMFDAFVNTACPRIADDQEAFGKPVLNPDMLEEVLEIWRKIQKLALK